MSFTIESARSIFPETQVANVIPATVESCNQLSAEDQLALLWFAYTETGVTITPAAMGAANMVFAEKTLTQIKQMPFREQTQVMCDLVNHSDAPICRTYSSFGTNVKLGFWYQLGEWMKLGIVAPVPESYELSAQASDVLQAIRQLEGGQQLTVLQNIVVNMGYAPKVNTQKVKEPVVPPKDIAPRAKVSIEGINNLTVLSYMENMNAFDFQEAVALFAEDGALQPPFQEPIVGRENILVYMREECYGLKLIPEQEVSKPKEGEFTQIKVTGKVQTPWFGDSVGINLAWRFLLNPQGKIFFVAIDVLASPQELLNMGFIQ
jgi:hypothetical protein